MRAKVHPVDSDACDGTEKVSVESCGLPRRTRTTRAKSRTRHRKRILSQRRKDPFEPEELERLELDVKSEHEDIVTDAEIVRM